jgi:hypothetical protein
MICYFGWTLSTLALPDLTTIVLDRGFADVCISVLKARHLSMLLPPFRRH